MSFTEPIFLIFLPVTVLLYRFFPKKARWGAAFSHLAALLRLAQCVSSGPADFSPCWSATAAPVLDRPPGKAAAGPGLGLARNWVCWQCSNI